jgi:hypothetical protein
MALAGFNRAEVERGLGKHDQTKIKAYGLLPLRYDETVLERYLALKQLAKAGQKYGQQRRANHAAAVKVALANLAQVAGYPERERFELAMEAQIAQTAPDPQGWAVGDYAVAVSIDGTEASVTVSRGGKALKSVPESVRKSAEYKEAQTAVKHLRAQAARVRTEVLEAAMAGGSAFTGDEFAHLLTMPAAHDMLHRLILANADGVFGLLTSEGDALAALDGTLHPLGESVSIPHSYHLFQNGTLAAWQEVVVRRRIVQPFKQAFRELYLLTPAERETRLYSNRFTQHEILTAQAVRLLTGRGWQFEQGEFPQPFKAFPQHSLQAVWAFPDTYHFFTQQPTATADRIYFEPYPLYERNWQNPHEHAIPLEDVPPLLFSEVMRDADLVVSVAQAEDANSTYVSPESYTRRGDLVRTLLNDLGLPGVTVDGHFAYVQGKLARYRVHLGSAVIHIEPGQYLCIVPARWGQTHPRLFLPFADEDRKMSEVVSKILLLLADDRIKDESIVRQLRHRTEGQ